MAKKYVEIGGPSDAELKKIEKEQKDIYTMPLKELFKVDEDIEVQDSACDDYYVNEWYWHRRVYQRQVPRN